MMFWPFSTIYNAILALSNALSAFRLAFDAHRAELRVKLDSIEKEVKAMALDLTGLKAAVANVQTEVTETAAQVQKLRDLIAAGGDTSLVQTELDTIAGKLNAAADSLNSLQDS